MHTELGKNQPIFYTNHKKYSHSKDKFIKVSECFIQSDFKWHRHIRGAIVVVERVRMVGHLIQKKL